MELDGMDAPVLNKKRMPRFSTAQRLLFEVLFSRPFFRLLILCSSFMAAACGLMAPFFQKEFIDTLTGNVQSLQQTLGVLRDFLPSTPLGFLILAFLAMLLNLSLNGVTNYLGARESVIMQRRLAQRLYDRLLVLRTDSLKGRPIGEMVSIYATDIPSCTILLEQSLPQGLNIFFPFVLSPFAIWFFFHIPLWPIIAMMATTTLIGFFMAYRQSRFFFRFKRLAAERTGLVNEWVQNIRTLRILGWMNAFEERIFSVRRVETDNRISMLINGQTMNAMSSSATFLLNTIALMSLVFLSDQPVTSGTLLALLWIVGVFLTRSFRMTPWFFTFLFDAWTSLKRVDAVMLLKNEDTHVRPTDFQKLKSLSAPDPALRVKNLNLAIGGKSILKSLHFEIKPGEFVAIVGEVGSGKSMLLLSLLGEAGASFDRYDIGANDALGIPLDQLRQFFTFVPQEGFIMSASLRENVAFEYGADPKKVDDQVYESLRRSQFDVRVERIEQGLDTEIGERGVNLSGGQKQRVSLARVDFYQAPVVLLDDCLSAVDVDTENKLIAELMEGSWKKRTRVLVTHRLTVLEKSDRILFLQNGEIRADGTFHDLLENNEDFRLFVSTVAAEKSKKNVPPEVIADPVETALAVTAVTTEPEGES
jgi:ABC-type multidrug transport system fused ATPase/permease subunit